MKILVIGANSYVGARIFFDLKNNFELVGTYHSYQLSTSFKQLDITNPENVDRFISEVQPKLIIHLANNANSRWCEANPNQAILLNEKSTSFVVDAANKNNSKIIFISSFAAFEPSNVYAKSKLNSEAIIKQTEAGWNILRPSLILGYSPNTTNDRPFNRLLKNLDEGTLAEYDTSWRFQPTYLAQISEVIKEIIKRNIDHETIPIAVDELKSRFDTANDILSPFGITVIPVDKQDKAHFSEKKDLSKLRQLSLPQYSYPQMIDRIIEEIKNRDDYVLK